MRTKELKASIHVVVLSGFYYIAAACLLLAGFVYCFFPDFLRSNFTDNAIMQKMANEEFVVYGVIMISISILEALLAYKLSRLSKWARVIALVISILGFIWALVTIFIYGGLENIIFMILHAYFIWILRTRYYGK